LLIGYTFNTLILTQHMKITFIKLICLSLFISSSLSVSAQALPDTMRIAIGLDGGYPTGSIQGRYNAILGASLRVDIPFSKKSYITGGIGYNNYFLGKDATTTQQAILNVPVQMLRTMPIKIGYKYFLFPRFYVQGEVGETVLLNKAEVYATNSATFTYAPQFGIIFRLKKPNNYIDTGLRYEGASSFYNDQDKYNFWAVHLSYAFNL